MLIESHCVIPFSPDPIWELLLDIPRTAFCVPGVQSLEPGEEGRFQATLQARVGPITLAFSGTIELLEQNPDIHTAKFRVQGLDRRVGGSFQTQMTVRLIALDTDKTQLDISADTTFMGKLGEFGQPLIRRKTATTIDQFAKNLAQQLEQRS